MRLLVKGGRVIDPANNIDEIADVLVIDGKIAAIGKELSPDGNEDIVDAEGKIVCPGFIDIHVHLRDPGYEYKEDIITGSKAAAAGGFTAVCSMPNTDPVVDEGIVAEYVLRKSKEVGLVNVLPVGSITKNLEGEGLSEMAELAQAGCVGFSDDGKPVVKSDVMRHAMDYARMLNLPILSHCEDLALSRNGLMHEGYYSTLYGLQGIPAAAEEIMVARDVRLAGITRARLHLCHVSTEGSLRIIEQAKAAGISVTCEVTPHHLTLTDETVGDYDTDTKVNPPLRSERDVKALVDAVASGLVDCIATDHAPQNIESKDCEYANASFGISGLETAVAVIMDRLVHPGLLRITDMVRLFTVGPGRILGLDSGTLTPGSKADITIIDPDAKRRVDPSTFYSKGKNTPFKGMELCGWPWMTIREGRVIAREGRIV
ncbi:MAG: dihydroorotase, partial [Firmicutes bacterium]|nr:dihydroorotase [Bacillota bacterium]